MLARTFAVRSLALVLAGGLAVACSPRDEDNNAAVADSLAADTMAPAAQPAPPTDAQIAKIVLGANTADSAAGELAVKKGTSEQVKAFGRRMIQDHGAANQQATELAQKTGLNPEDSETSRQMQMAADSNMQSLQGLSGADFDRAYIDHEVQLHQQVLNALDQQLIPNAQNAELKQLLEKVRPTIDSHLQQVQQIQANMQNQAAKPAG